MKIINIVGARPNFMKIAPILRAYEAHDQIEALLVHTGQHYDKRMSESFFEHLEIRDPDINLEVGSGSHAVQTAEIMRRFESVVLEHKPDVVLVVGDVNSTIACGLVAVKLGVKLVHVEAGLRSFDRDMPEEINRLLTDAISDLLLCSEQSGVDNLRKEGVSQDKIVLVGNVMIDSLIHVRPRTMQSSVLQDLNLRDGEYAVLTLHRPSNVDDEAVFAGILDAIDVVQKQMPVIFPIHPRTRKNLETGSLHGKVVEMKNLRLEEPLGYLDFGRLVSGARLVLTDSGGIQEETTYLGIPCLTLRENTERPSTVQCGSNQIVGVKTERIIEAFEAVMAGRKGKGQVPPLWDGHAADRIARTLVDRYGL